MRAAEAVESILRYPDEGLDCGARFLLASTLLSFGWEPVACTVGQLAERFGVSAGLVTKARKSLISRQLIVPRPSLSASRKRAGLDLSGRPRKGFQANRIMIESLLAQRDLSGESSRGGHEKVEDLPDRLGCLFPGRRLLGKARVDAGADLSQRKRGRPKDEEPRLLSDNRVLLGVLLAHADDLGIVTGLGTSDFGRLAGMSAARVRGQLQKLEQLGYITSMVPGVTSRTFFGVGRALIFLNLGHDSWEILPRPAQASVECGSVQADECTELNTVFQITADLRSAERYLRQGGSVGNKQKVYRYRRSLSRLLQIVERVHPEMVPAPVSDDSPWEGGVLPDVDGQITEMWGEMARLDRLLVDRPGSPQANYVFARLATYATQILNIETKVLSMEPGKSAAYAGLRQRIKSEAIPKAWKEKVASKEQEWLVKLLYGFSWSIAKQARIWVAKVHETTPLYFDTPGRYLIVVRRRPVRYELLFTPLSDFGRAE